MGRYHGNVVTLRAESRGEILTEHGDEVLVQGLGPSIDFRKINFVG